MHAHYKVLDFDPCYILHVRPFRDTSALLDCFTQNQGLLSFVGRGVKRPRSRFYGLVQPFILLKIRGTGRGELKTLTHLEAASSAIPRLEGEKILVGFYVNELLLKLLQKLDPTPTLFQAYNTIITQIAFAKTIREQEIYLRLFEVQLLAALGYGLDLKSDYTQKPILHERYYKIEPGVGFLEGKAHDEWVISGESIIALREGIFETGSSLQEAKKLMRLTLGHYLGGKPLQSRKLFFAK